jgi:hypothetical protein
MKYLLPLFFIISASLIHAQKQIVWFDAGLKAQYGATGLYNSAIANASNYDYTISTGYSYGGKIGINFAYNGLSIDVMKSKATQEFEQNTGSGAQRITSVDWESLDIYALFRNAKNLGYFEIGPKISFIDRVEDNVDGSAVERTPSYNKNVYSGVIGFGANILGNDGRFSGILGLRFEYAFSDFVSAEGKEAFAPLRDASVYSTNGYKSSNIAFAGVVFEFNWGIGYYGKAQCGSRSKFIMF